MKFKNVRAVLVSVALLMPLGASAVERNLGQTADDQFESLARGIHAEYITRNAGQDLDQIQFLPVGSQEPTHIIACIEESLQSLDESTPPYKVGDKLNPGVQIIDISDGPQAGMVHTLVRGMQICDGIRTTEWGTVVATEEDFRGDVGSAYEIFLAEFLYGIKDITDLPSYTILDRKRGGQPAHIIDDADGSDADPDLIRKLLGWPVIRYEGLYIDPTGVVVAGDEERPGSYRRDAGGDTDGGAIYKIMPANPREPGEGPIAFLSNSPLVETGAIYALQVRCNSSQFGQGCEVGEGEWVELEPQLAEVGDMATAGEMRIGREAANDAGATGYYRPEDLHKDPMYSNVDHPNAVRMCFAATGNPSQSDFGQINCIIDYDITTGDEPLQVYRFVEGGGGEDGTGIDAPDNVAFHPTTGILYVIEDRSQSDVWGCLPDGDDKDLRSDGCVKLFRLVQLDEGSAEATGLIFTPDGKEAIFNIQHSGDNQMPLFDDFRTDDLMRLSGFRTGVSKRDWGRFTERLLELLSRWKVGF